MKAEKSSIITNQSVANIETNFQIGTAPINDIKSPSDIFRILGVYLTLDGNHNQTITHATEWLDKILTKIKTKFTYEIYHQCCPNPNTGILTPNQRSCTLPTQ